MGLKLFLKLFELFKHHTNILVGTNILHRAPPPLHKYHVHASSWVMHVIRHDHMKTLPTTTYGLLPLPLSLLFCVSVLYFEGMRDSYFLCKNSFTQDCAYRCLQLKVAGPADMSLSLLSIFYLVLNIALNIFTAFKTRENYKAFDSV